MLLHMSPSQIACAMDGTIILGGPEEGWPPFIIPGQAGAPATGIMPDVLRAVAADLGYVVVEAYYPEKRGLLRLDDGGLDAWPKSEKWVPDPDRYLWTDEVLTSTDVLVYRKHSPMAYACPADLADRNICVVHGYAYPTLDPLFEEGVIQRQKAPTVLHMLRMLDRGHVEGAICNRFVAEWVLREDETLRPDDFAYSEVPVDSAPYRFAFTRARDWSGFITRFNQVLAAMRLDGRLDVILNRYK